MQRDRWRLGPFVHEVVRNVFDVRAKLFPALLLAVIAGSALGVVAAVETANLQRQLVDLQRAGRLVYTITSQDENNPVRIDRESCEQLMTQAGVERSGLVIASSYDEIPQLGTRAVVVRASQTLFPELSRSTALVGSALRTQGPDFTLKLPDGYAATATVMQEQPKGIDTNSSVVVPLDPRDSYGESCKVVFSPYNDTQEAAARAVAALKVVGSSPVKAESPYQENVNVVSAYLARTTRYLPVLVGLLGGFAAAVIDRVRLSEFAAYRLSGTSGRSMAGFIFTEHLLLGGALASAAALAAVALPLMGYEISVTAVTLAGMLAGATWVVAGCLLTLDIPWRKPTNLAKDR